MEIKLQQVLTMAHLLLLGAYHNYVEITTTQLSKDINRSQQSASKHLLDLEKRGYITRIRKGHTIGIKVTDKGHSQVNSLYERIKTIDLGVTLICNLDPNSMTFSNSG